MATISFHTILYILSIIILAAVAVIISVIAYVTVKVIFFSPKDNKQLK